jgi:hypothetical protein
MARSIVIPLYPHTTDEEVTELLDRLGELGLALDPVVVSAWVATASVETLRLASHPIAGRPGWRRDYDGREWYSADWL